MSPVQYAEQDVIEEVLEDNQDNWKKHYHGSFKQLGLARKYSYSDRVRYYMGDPKIAAAIDKLFENLKEYAIPMNMLHQYMPIQYRKVVRKELTLDPKDLVLDGVAQFMEDYEYAAQQGGSPDVDDEQRAAS